MFHVMKFRMTCTILPHSLCVLQNVHGADIIKKKSLGGILCLSTRSF